MVAFYGILGLGLAALAVAVFSLHRHRPTSGDRGWVDNPNYDALGAVSAEWLSEIKRTR